MLPTGHFEAAAQPPRPRRASPPLVDEQPEGFDAVRRRADAARDAGRLEEAMALYERAVTLRPGWAEGAWYLGTLAYDAERWTVCRDAFGRVVRVRSGDGAAWAFRGLCEFRLAEYEPALRDLEKANDLGIGREALIPVARYHRAMLLTKAGQFERAVQAYVAFVREGNPAPEIEAGLGTALLRLRVLPGQAPAVEREAAALAGRAVVLGAAGDTAGAAEAWERLVVRFPRLPNVHYRYGEFLLRDRPEAAVKAFREELAISPDHAPARVRLAEEALKHGDVEAAHRWASEAVAIAPRDFVARRVLGQAALERGDVAGAIVQLEKAMALEPRSPSVRYALARAYQRAGRAAAAARERAAFTRLERLQQAGRGGANAVGGIGAGEIGEEPK